MHMPVLISARNGDIENITPNHDGIPPNCHHFSLPQRTHPHIPENSPKIVKPEDSNLLKQRKIKNYAIFAEWNPERTCYTRFITGLRSPTTSTATYLLPFPLHTFAPHTRRHRPTTLFSGGFLPPQINRRGTHFLVVMVLAYYTWERGKEKS